MSEDYHFADVYDIRPCETAHIPDNDLKTDIRLIGYNECATRFLATFKLNGKSQYVIYTYNMLLEECGITPRQFKEIMFLR